MKNITFNDFEPLEIWINDTLVKKYNDALLKSIYNYYKQNLEGKLENMFNDIFNKWKDIYSNLFSDVRKNKKKIRSSLFEFSMIASIYRSIIGYELTQNYYNSIVLFQESEFNYAISFYYNYLIKLIKKYYKYIINKIQTKEYDFNDAIKERKKEIENIFDIFIDNITDSGMYYLTLENQLEILQVTEDDFFGVKNIMEKNINETDKKLEKMVKDISREEADIKLPGDEYSLVMRFYLENKELGKLITTYYGPIDSEEFFDFNLNKFKNVMKENWVFDEGDFIYILNNALFSTNKVIKNELAIEMEDYSNKIEKEITKSFNDSLENIIDDFYKNEFKFITKNIGREIENYIFIILDSIKKSIQKEAERIDDNSGVYNLSTDKIKEKIEEYKKLIISKLNNTIFDGLNKFQENIYNNVYLNCIQKGLNDYLTEAKIDDAEFGEFKLVNSSYNIADTIYDLAKSIIDNYKELIFNKINFNYYEYYEKIKSILDIEQINQNINSTLNKILEEELLPVLNTEHNCSSIGCEEFDFNYDTYDEINNGINTNLDNINNIMLWNNNTYEVNFWCPLDFTNVGINLIKPICKSFKRFLTYQNQEQGTLINQYIQNYIKNNLDDFLNNVVPTFGNPFFERIVDYNINFKITDFYHNLRYSFEQTVLYYYILTLVQDAGDLPKDLKERLYRLNDLDSTLKIKQQEIKKLLERKLFQLIEDLKDTAKETYVYYLKENEIIKNSFSARVLEKIDYNLEAIMEDLDKKYQKALEKYLKEKFITDFSEILEQKTKYNIDAFYAEQKRLISDFDKLFSSNEDKDLHEVNTIINQTLESIGLYNEFCDTFEISNSVINFFLNYGNTTLVPLFSKFDEDLNNKMRIIIIDEINNKSKIIENLDYNVFNSFIWEKYDYIYNNYISNVMNSIISYGKSNESYQSNLDYTKNKIYEKLSDNLKEDPSPDEAKKMIETKDVENALTSLYTIAYNNYYGINKLKAYNDFLEKANNFINKVNTEVMNIKVLISNNKYNDKINLYLNGKIDTLKTRLNNYYSQIYYKFINIYSLLRSNNSLIYSYLYNSKYYTQWVLNHEYEIIKKNTKLINYRYSNYSEKYDDDIDKDSKPESEHMINNVIFDIYNIYEYVEFKLDLILEGTAFKRPKVKGRIVSTSVPKNIEFDIYSLCGECCKEGFKYNITLNSVNYTLTVDYDAKTNNINIKTYTNIEPYNISEIFYFEEKKFEIYEGKLTDGSLPVVLPTCSRTEKNYTIYYQNTTQISSEYFESTKNNHYY